LLEGVMGDLKILKEIAEAYQDIFLFDFDSPSEKPGLVKFIFITINTLPILLTTSDLVNMGKLVVVALFIHLFWGLVTFLQKSKMNKITLLNFRSMLLSVWIAAAALCIAFFKLFTSSSSFACFSAFIVVVVLLFMHLCSLKLGTTERILYFLSTVLSVVIFMNAYIFL
jgi:hypothetical protein